MEILPCRTFPESFVTDRNIVATSAITFPTNSRELLNSVADELTRAAVVRALVTYITVPENRGGLGVSPESHEYPHLKLVLSPHPLQVKKEWIKKLTGGLGFGYSNGDIAHIAAFVSSGFFHSTFTRIENSMMTQCFSMGKRPPFISRS